MLALLFLLRGHAIAGLVAKIVFAFLLVLLFQVAPLIAAAVCVLAIIWAVRHSVQSLRE
ncbi:hypothetical protein [Deefgea salmonis]|uniref:Uncharacterized protein n=1 Tax=Deefgea salmonis TaxID=2875502 RepID=A0ABS8BN00_9NEIS|nr:hypothetical protein [Deefgea salmonis]MCB5196866.1 hypothetical protein [Deefgea salmonis]